MDPKVKAVIVADRAVRAIESALDKATRGQKLINVAVTTAPGELSEAAVAANAAALAFIYELQAKQSACAADLAAASAALAS